MGAVQRAWDALKIWRQIHLGPVSLIYRFRRTVKVSRNAPRRGSVMQGIVGSANALLAPVGPAFFVAPASSGSHSAESEKDNPPEVAVIFGVGPGFGFSLARKLAREGFCVAIVSRQARHLTDLALAINTDGSRGKATVYSCDVTDEEGVREVLSLVKRELGVPSLVVYSTQRSASDKSVDVSTAAFEECWRTNCLGGFIVAREAARLMRPRHHGSIILVGSTSGLIGRERHLLLAVGKFGLRAVAQVMSRELWQEGIHVAHMVIDADIDGPEKDASEVACNPDDVAEVAYSLHRQPNSAWASEIDVRPANERFWEHC